MNISDRAVMSTKSTWANERKNLNMDETCTYPKYTSITIKHTDRLYGRVLHFGSEIVCVSQGTTESWPKVLNKVSTQQYNAKNSHSSTVSIGMDMKWRLGLGPKRKKLLLNTPSEENTPKTTESHTTRTTAVSRLSTNKEENIFYFYKVNTVLYISFSSHGLGIR
jgi:hypothetical protein